MIEKIYMQEGWITYHNIKDKTYSLIINYNEEQFYEQIRISFVENEKNIYKIKGMLCQTEHEDITIGDFELMIIDDSITFELYEIYFSENLKEKIENILKKGIEFIKEKQSESKLLDIIKWVRERKELQFKIAFEQLDKFLNMLEAENYD